MVVLWPKVLGELGKRSLQLGKFRLGLILSLDAVEFGPLVLIPQLTRLSSVGSGTSLSPASDARFVKILGNICHKLAERSFLLARAPGHTRLVLGRFLIHFYPNKVEKTSVKSSKDCDCLVVCKKERCCGHLMIPNRDCGSHYLYIGGRPVQN